MKRPIRFVAECVLAVLLVVLLGLGALIWRLDQKPISLNTALPEIESFMAGQFPGLHFKIGKGSLRAIREYNAIGLRLDGVTVINENGKTVGSLQQVRLGFTWQSLMSLSLMPGAIEITRPTISITRFENGYVGFSFQEKEEKPEEAIASSISMEDIGRFFQKAPRALRFIRVNDAWVRYDNREYGYQIVAEQGLLDFRRRGPALSGTLSVRVKSGDFDQKIQGTITDVPEKQQTKLIIGLKDMDAKQLPLFEELLPKDVVVDMPVSVLFTGLMDRAFRPVGSKTQVTAQKGAITYAPYYPEPLNISDFILSADYTAKTDIMDIQNLAFKLDDSAVSASVQVVNLLDHFKKISADEKRLPLKLHTKALVQDVPVDRLKEYWPQTLGHNAREWVTVQIKDGVANRATLNLDATINENKEFILDEMGGTIAFKGLTVDYLPPMPPVKEIDGTATYNANSFTIAATSGQLFDTKVSKADVVIKDIDNDDTNIKLAIEMAGPIKDAITVLSSKPLEYAQAMNMRAEQFDGNTKTHLNLAFPLVLDLSLDDVDMKAEAVLTDAVARDVVKDLDVSGKEFNLAVDTKELHVTGSGFVADGPVSSMEWREYFSADAPLTTDIQLKGAITPKAIKDLRLPIDHYFTGQADANITLTQDNEKSVHVTVAADLARTAIAIPEIGTQKKMGVPGKASLNVRSDTNGVTTLSDMNVHWPDFAIQQGSIRFDKDQNAQSATLKGIRSGRTQADIVMSPDKNGATRIVMSGKVIDLSGYWTAQDKPKDPNEKPSTARRNISVRADTLYLDTDVPFKDMKADIALRGEDIIRAQVTAKTDQNASLLVQKLDKRSGGQALIVRLNNAGRILEALDASDGIKGGTLSIVANSTAQNPNDMIGRVVMDKFTMIKAPVMARLLNAFSPVGLLRLLNEKGLAFQKLSSDIKLTNMKVVKFSKGKLSGDSLGLSFNGYYYRDNSTLNIKGTIIPVEGLNKMAGNIPILGHILTGLKGEGMFAATYSIKGNTDEPDVFVNPLSVLTPGILRSIFFESGS